MADFDTWRAFAKFEREVSQKRRYVRTAEAERFLDAVRRTCHSRSRQFSEGRGFWRAQVGHDWRYESEIDDKLPTAFPPKRMIPLTDRAMEGRANPKGIPALYLCTNKEAAMSEVRPWLGSMISLARFDTTKDLRVVDCTRHSDKRPPLFLEKPPDEEFGSVVWSDIDRAFTKPVTRSDDTGEYVATQILTELFRDLGFDGIAYRSAFGERSVNLALFDLSSARVTYCQLYEATHAKFNFQERDNPYWVRSAGKARTPKSKRRQPKKV